MKKYVLSLSGSILISILTLIVSFILIYNGVLLSDNNQTFWYFVGIDYIICGSVFVIAFILNVCNIKFFAKPIENFSSKRKFVITTIVFNCLSAIVLLYIDIITYNRTLQDFNSSPFFDISQLIFSIAMIILNVFYLIDIFKNRNLNKLN